MSDPKEEKEAKNLVVDEFVPVEGSSNIEEFKYTPEDKSLYIRYMSRRKREKGPLYKYAGVELGVYKDMTEAESKGRFVHKEIKGTYEYEKVKNG